MGTITFDNDAERIAFKSRLSCSCNECGELADYSDKYDAWYCPDCNIWLEVKCGDPECEFCSVRPDNPND